jgi:hypothetical protein
VTGVVQWGGPGRFSREPLMINRGRGDIRRLAAGSAISGAGDWAASTALAPVPHTTGP